ncbi:MAG: transglutaminase domain-containing protein [Planctomycetes bacterium]|nr:transglutaminase domain-containing protein [Planctomycetota bacterium]
MRGMRWAMMSVLLASVAWTEGPEPLQVLKDGAFDSEPSQTPGAGWFNQAAGAGKGVTSEWKKDAGRGGTPGVHVAATEDLNLPLIWRRLVTSPPPLRRYRLKAWVRSRDVTGNVLVCARCSDAAGTLVGFGTTQGTCDVSGTTEWQEVTATFVAPETTQHIEILCFLMGRGECWFDDVSLEAGEAAEAPAAPIPAPAQEPASDTPAGNGSSQEDLGKDLPGMFHLRGVYDVNVAAATAEPVVLLPLPLSWGAQVPLRWELRANPSAMVRSWRAYERKPRVWVAEVRLQPLEPCDRFHLEWEADLLCGPSAHTALPGGVPLEKLGEIPEEARPWLASTRCVQSGHERFQAIAKEVKSSAKDVADLVARIQAKLLDVYRAEKGQAKSLDALEALDRSGSCTSCANVTAALYRACGFPARVVSGYPVWSGPLQTHYIVEVHFPGHGWFPVESTLLRTPWPQSQQLAVSVVYPEDEERSAQRWCAADGVPYLSLTETPGGDDHFSLQGAIPDHAACDHEAVRTRDFAVEDAAWSDVLAAARSRWDAWLALAGRGPVPEAERVARRPLAECGSLAELRAELSRLDTATREPSKR